MPESYSVETKKILADFVQALEAHAEIDRRFLQVVKTMTATGKLGNRGDIRRALEMLEREENEL